MLAAAVAVLVVSMPGAPDQAADPRENKATATSTAGVLVGAVGTATAATAVADVLTATSAGPGALAIDAPPLSDEDLALIAAITTPTVTAAQLVPRAPPLAPVTLDRARVRATVPRTLGEALLGEPTALAIRRHHVAGDDVLFRGRGGTRLDVRLDNLGVDDALTRFDDRAGLGLVDPWLLDGIALTDRDRLTLTTLRPSGALHTFAAVHGRSADRSSGVTAIADGSLGPAGLLFAGRYDDFGRLRTDADHDAAPWPYQRAGLHARARLLGREGDPIDVVAGADLDRLTNVEDRTARDELHLRHAAFIDATVRVGDLAARATAGVRSTTLERESGAVIPRQDALAIEARAEARYRLGPFTAGVSGGLLSSDGTVERARAVTEGTTRVVDGALDLGLTLEVLEIDAAVGLRAATTDVGAGFGGPAGAMLAAMSFDAAGVITDGRITARPTDALAIAAAWRYDLRLPTLGDVIALGPGVTAPERSLLVEAGPSLALTRLDVAVVGYARWIERALEPIPGGGATYVEGALIGGAESRATWRPIEPIAISAAVGWTTADRVLAGVPGVVVAASARWTSAESGWWVEVAGRGLVAINEASPAEAPPPNTLSVVDRREWSGALFGLRGGVPIGAGFGLALALDNAFDVRTRGYGAAINDPGVDFRAALTHAW